MAVEHDIKMVARTVPIPEATLVRLRAMLTQQEQVMARLEEERITRLTDVATAIGLDPTVCTPDLQRGVFHVIEKDTSKGEPVTEGEG